MPKKKTDKNLFQKLTQLFRSGPQIKRRVRGIPTTGSASTMQIFGRAHNDLYNNTMSTYGSFDRMSRYSDFSEMEATPEISAALDIYSEEATSVDEKGISLHIHSDNRKVKEILDTLFLSRQEDVFETFETSRLKTKPSTLSFQNCYLKISQSKPESKEPRPEAMEEKAICSSNTGNPRGSCIR